RGSEVAAQRDAVLDEPVDVIKKLNLRDTYHRGACLLFGDSQGPDLGRRPAGDACLAPGGKQVADLLSLPDPACDGRRRAVLEIVGVGDNRDGCLPVFRHWLHGSTPNHGGLARQKQGGPGMAGGRLPRRSRSRAASPDTLPCLRMVDPAWGRLST